MADFEEINNRRRTVFLLRIVDGAVSVQDKPAFYTRDELDSEQPPDNDVKRIGLYRKFLEGVVRRCSDIDTTIAVDINDIPWFRQDVPIFGFQKQRGSPTILLPDIDFLHLGFYRAADFDDNLPFEAKTCSAIFVGGTSGGGLITKEAALNLSVPRIRAAVYFKGNPLVDFRVPNIAQVDSEETRDVIRAMDISGERMTFHAQMSRKFMISMDGNGATCSRVAIALKSHCVLMKYDSPHVLYYFDRLIPWMHYIPIFRDCEIEPLVTLEAEGPGTFAFIAENGRQFFDEYLSFSRISEIGYPLHSSWRG